MSILASPTPEISPPDTGPSVLDTVSISSPCSMSWDAMEGGAAARFCAHCRQNVYDISQMTRAEAEALILEKQGRLCLRFYRRADGRIVTRDCQAKILGRTRFYRLALLVAFIGMVFALTFLHFLGARTEDRRTFLRRIEPFRTIMEWIDPTPPPPPPPPALMGAMFFF